MGLTKNVKTRLFFQDVLQWHEENSDVVGQSVKLNADCMIHAALEDDRERLAILYSYGYRLGTDTDRRINKDYLKRIKLFQVSIYVEEKVGQKVGKGTGTHYFKSEKRLIYDRETADFFFV